MCLFISRSGKDECSSLDRKSIESKGTPYRANALTLFCAVFSF